MILLRPATVQVRSIIGNAIAYKVTHVLVEWETDGEYGVRWEANCLVRPVQNSA